MDTDNIKLEDLLGKTKLASKAEQINQVAVVGGGIMGQGNCSDRGRIRN